MEVTGERFVLGRIDSGDLEIEDKEISREHAALRELPDGRLSIEDLGSRNGTFVNGERIAGPVTLWGAEEIRVGATRIAVEGAPQGATMLSPDGQEGASPESRVTELLPRDPAPLPQEPARAAPAPPPQAAGSPAPAGRASGPSGTKIVIIASAGVIAVVLLFGALMLAWGGPSETLYRLGVGDGWSAAEEEAARTELSVFFSSDDALDCMIDELQKRFTYSEFQGEGVDDAAAESFFEATRACGVR